MKKLYKIIFLSIIYLFLLTTIFLLLSLCTETDFVMDPTVEYNMDISIDPPEGSVHLEDNYNGIYGEDVPNDDRAYVTFQMTNNAPVDARFHYWSTDGTAHSISSWAYYNANDSTMDFISVPDSGWITVNSGQTKYVTIAVELIEDKFDETPGTTHEYAVLNYFTEYWCLVTWVDCNGWSACANAPCAQACGSMQIPIKDNDPLIALEEWSMSCTEGMDAEAKVFLQYAGSLAKTYGIDYETVAGTATGGGDDFVNKSGRLNTLTTNPDDNTITVVVNDDYYDEPDETFTIVLDNNTTGSTMLYDRDNVSLDIFESEITSMTYTFTILDDDYPDSPMNLTLNSVFPAISNSVMFPDMDFNDGVYGIVYQKGGSADGSVYFYSIEDTYCNVDTVATPITAPVLINQGSGTALAHVPKICAGYDDRFGVVWQDRRVSVSQIFFTEYEPDGTKPRASEVQVTTDSDGYTGYSAAADVTYNSSTDEYAIVWNDNSDTDCEFDIYFGLLDPDTHSFSSIKVSDTGEYETYRSSIPIIAWSGSYYGIVWWQTNSSGYEVSFARVRADGSQREGSIIKIADADWHTYPKIAWNETGSYFGIVYERSNEVYFARVTEAGTLSGYDMNISQSGTTNANGSRFPNITPRNDWLYVVWQEGYDIDNPDTDTYSFSYAYINSSGAIAQAATSIASAGTISPNGIFSGLPAPAYNSSENNIGLIWGQYYSSDSNNDVYIIRY